MATKQKRVAIYARLGVDEQADASQLRDLHAWAERSGHAVVAVFKDRGAGGARGRDSRPGFGKMLRAAASRDFDVVAVWSAACLDRSHAHASEARQTLRDSGVRLYVHTQALSMTKPINAREISRRQAEVTFQYQI